MERVFPQFRIGSESGVRERDLVLQIRRPSSTITMFKSMNMVEEVESLEL